MKDNYISKKIKKTINTQADYWKFYASPLGKKDVLSLGMPPFIGSN